MRVPLFPRAIPTAFLLLATAAPSFGDDTLRRRAAEVAAKTTLQVVPRPNAPEWGTSSQVLHSIGFADFRPSISGMTFATETGVYATSAGVFYATPHLPSGVLLTYFELDYCDTHPTLGVFLVFEECDFDGTNCATWSAVDSNLGGSGCNYIGLDLTPLQITINNFQKRLRLFAVTPSGSTATQLVGAYIGYKLQVSPAPTSATFLDVPTTHPFFRFVEALVAAGITAGCGSNNYCVNSPITRGEMAVFLSVALGLHFPN